MFGFKKKNANPIGEEDVKIEETKTRKDEWVWVTGYKGTCADMTCNGFQYELGKTYDMPADEVRMCVNGYHLCLKLQDVFNYYDVEDGNRFFKVKACVRQRDVDSCIPISNWGAENDKLVAKDIQFIEEVSEDEIWNACMSYNKADEKYQNVLLPYKPRLSQLGFEGIEKLYHTDVLVADGYSTAFASYVVDQEKFRVAHAVASQKDLSMDVKALYILGD